MTLPRTRLHMLRMQLLCSASVPVLDYAELKAQIAQMEQIKAGNYHVSST